ncbi:SDR family NAD(P)-dependent oxidoreductase [Leuconostoc sp. JNUCC 76]
MKNIVITGGGSGVGLAIAEDLVKDNKIILVGRNERKLTLAKNKLGENSSYVAGDLSTVLGRKKVVDFILKNTDHVDVLIHSAGIYPTSNQDNIDINLLSHYYLTMSLVKVLNDSRVLIVTGNPQAIKMAPVCEKQLNDILRAAWAVTHKTLLMFLLADKLRIKRTTVNSFFPGDVKSDLMAYTKSLTNTSVPVGRLLSLDEQFDNITGQFFDENGLPVNLNSEKYNKSVATSVLSKYITEVDRND